MSLCEASKLARIGAKAPSWIGSIVKPNMEFGKLSCDDLKGKWYVLFSYPLDWTFVCPTEIISFSEASKKFKDVGCEVVGVSVDSVFSHLSWMQQPRKEGGLGEMKIPLIGDLGGKICQKFGWYLDDAGHSTRGTAIVDPDGIVKHLSQNHPDVGRNIDETLRLVKGFQHAAKHGEVCPAMWKDGDEAMKASVQGAKEYFAKHN